MYPFSLLSSSLLSFEDMSSLQFSLGSVFVLLACVCWGFENNCTRMLSSKNPAQIVIIKGFCSGIGSLILSLIIGERFFQIGYIVIALLLGFVAYGLSISFIFMLKEIWEPLRQALIMRCLHLLVQVYLL